MNYSRIICLWVKYGYAAVGGRLDFGLRESATDGGDGGTRRRDGGGGRGGGRSDCDGPAAAAAVVVGRRRRRPAAAPTSPAAAAAPAMMQQVPVAEDAASDGDDDGVEGEGAGDQATEHVVDAPEHPLHARTQWRHSDVVPERVRRHPRICTSTT